jgi:two-component system phosphate regulon sensor histidine kinase PhoR
VTDAEALNAILGRGGPDAAVITDGQLRIERASVEAAVLAERPFNQLPGLSLIAAFGSASLDELARSALDHRRAQSGETALGPLAGRQFEADAIPLPSGGVLLWLHEVTAARRAAQARRDVVANISHELRTPLASIKLLAETLADGAAGEVEIGDEFAVQIQREVDHLAQLVDELLDLSLIESGESALKLEVVTPGEVLEDVASRIGPTAARREIWVRTVVHPDPADVRVTADPDRLSQALLNLAHNAVKFSHPGSEIRLGWELRGDQVRFWVADDGVGIALRHRGRIFERFYKGDRSRTRDETDDGARDLGGASAGLGLAIVRGIIEAHGGTLEARSAGDGACFLVTLPTEPVHGAAWSVVHDPGELHAL